MLSAARTMLLLAILGNQYRVPPVIPDPPASRTTSDGGYRSKYGSTCGMVLFMVLFMVFLWSFYGFFMVLSSEAEINSIQAAPAPA
jgi:hypothetical protein